MVTAGRVATASVAHFADVLAETTAETGEIAGEAIGSGVEQAGDVGSAIVARVRELLEQVSLRSDQPMGLDISPLGDLYVSTEMADRGHVEAALGSDAQLHQLLNRWTSLTGQSTFRYNP